MHIEFFKPINNTEGRYEISSFGRIRAVYYTSKTGRKCTPNTIVRQQINYKGYNIIGLRFGENDKKTVKTHRLVAIHFHPNPHNKPQVNHKDLNKLNNFYLNLEWATAKENTNHAQIDGKMKMGRKPVILKGPYKGKKIIDIDTGKIYDCCKDLSGINKYYPQRVYAEIKW